MMAKVAISPFQTVASWCFSWMWVDVVNFALQPWSFSTALRRASISRFVMLVKRAWHRAGRGNVTRDVRGISKRATTLAYAFNTTGKTRLCVAYKDATKREDGTHTGVYYNAFSEDLFVWDNDEENHGADVRPTAATSQDSARMSNSKKTSSTEEDGKPALVPKLRFPGFTRPWSYDPISKALVEHKLKNADGREVFSVSMESGIVNQIEHLGRSYAASDTAHYGLGRRFDVVYTKSPLKAFPFGIVKQCKFEGEVALSPLYGVFTPANKHVGLLIEAYFESPNRSKAFLSPLCQKGAKNTIQITNSTFLSGRLPLPADNTEQRKIAECLSSLDEVIAAQARKVDTLKTHKKGLMQQLFPAQAKPNPGCGFRNSRMMGRGRRESSERFATFNAGGSLIGHATIQRSLEGHTLSFKRETL